jgi:glycosyltransferase involved in cell wall biosynthesis|uniref:Glycosyltransferase n=1 Tax=Desulfobacca acetoxidans TaxID=60893 RepID=A0A7V6DPV2_9BACT
MDRAVLSIVIPTLNEEKYLPCLLESLQHQTFRDFEIIVADANSRDATRRIARAFGCKLVAGGRIAEGRNAGARHAQGEYVLFLDADVTVAPTFLEELLDKIAGKNLDVASGFITPDSKKIFDRVMVTISNLWHFAIQYVYPHASGFYIVARKTLHDAIGGFDEELFLTEDHDYVIRAARFGKFRYLWKPRVKFSVRRFDKEGRWRLIGKYFYLELHMLFKKVKEDVVDYEFGKF